MKIHLFDVTIWKALILFPTCIFGNYARYIKTLRNENTAKIISHVFPLFLAACSNFGFQVQKYKNQKMKKKRKRIQRLESVFAVQSVLKMEEIKFPSSFSNEHLKESKMKLISNTIIKCFMTILICSHALSFAYNESTFQQRNSN